jgi:hypothetical protein
VQHDLKISKMNSRTTKRALTKNKKWRKIDNTSVDRMTIEKTQEVLEGDVATKSDDQLFVIDTVVNKSKFFARDHNNRIADRRCNEIEFLINISCDL